jgi:UDP-GlcNAc:undecaprenyl-phosphate GlcNAc-1-phosphate transferase
MLIAAVFALVVGAFVFPEISSGLTSQPRQTIGLFVAAVMITIVGLVDDRFNLRARYKLLGQLAAVLVLILGGGFLVQRIGMFGAVIELGLMAVPCTALWLLACMNALNLIDGMDGLLGIVGGIALISLAIIAAMSGHVFAAVVALALAGAVLGFLWWNLPPASIYMGDAGSMLIGLVVGAVAIPASLKGPATIALGAPLAILVLPIFDTAAAVVRRKLTGRGLATADRGHLHHVLMRNGLTAQRVLIIVGILGLVASGGALASAALKNDFYALVASVGVVIALVAGKLFGNAELNLIHKRVAAAVRAIWPGDSSSRPWELAIRLQGVADWDLVWEDLTNVAYRLNFQTVCLDVNAPAMHENYHARWDRPNGPPETYLWRLEVPLFINKLPIGRLAVAAERDDQSLTDALLVLIKIVEVAEIRAAEVTGSKEMPALIPPASPAKPILPIVPEPVVPVRV